ncbi:MAG: TetR family transcriptional regulator [Sideroxydans sp.]|nr:TetR family transcriptional regulator [Sideroxydans sp.]
MNMSANNRDRLFSAAVELFLEHGYDASVDMIISRAGVARQTFYNHFQNKESLFVEVMRDCMCDLLVPLTENSGDLYATLKKFATAYRQRALCPAGVSGYRTMVGQAQRFPDLTREAFESGIGHMVNILAQLLGKAMERGELRKVEPMFAAEMLMSMLAGLERSRLLMGAVNPPYDETARVESIVDGFLRMFAPHD